MRLLQNIINLHKPVGPTSHDMVDLVRRATGEKTVGHAGTLDPFAQGVLLVLVGREMTRRQKEFMQFPKTYVATLKFGATSDTDDLTGRITELRITNDELNSQSGIRNSVIANVLNSFVGDIEQVPPAYSAVKLSGKKAYEIARKGGAPALKPKTVHIESIRIIRYEWPELEIEVVCGSGTYIRALARDIGEELHCGAYVEKLARTRIGPYTIEEAVHPEDLSIA
ncbi:MAG: tRNA pseudouridine(55) synthase TruB [bacterium]|nr:tRNA pseudouridine(55) synthase TruB [bacterium]